MAKTENAMPKRRGRRPKKILAKEELPEDDNVNETRSNLDSSIILQMKIDPTKLSHVSRSHIDGQSPMTSIKNPEENEIRRSRKVKSNQVDPDVFSERVSSRGSNPDTFSGRVTELSEDSSDGMFRNDIPKDAICSRCSKHEKTIMALKTKMEKYENKENNEKSSKIRSHNPNMLSAIDGKKIPDKKDVWCLWDGHPFENKPFHLPEYYHNGIYYVAGYFCSPNCALAHNLYYIKDSKVHQRRALVIKMYREMLGISLDDTVELMEAPSREVLSRFGGDLLIDQFRKASILLTKEYIIYHPPTKPFLSIIEERPINNFDSDEKKYVLKRKTPLKKKNSVISSMAFISGSKTSNPKQRKPRTKKEKSL